MSFAKLDLQILDLAPQMADFLPQLFNRQLLLLDQLRLPLDESQKLSVCRPLLTHPPLRGGGNVPEFYDPANRSR
jgi:hypothetical protein